MINRGHRFHGYGSLKYVYAHGQTIRGPLFSVKSVVNQRRKAYRLAVVVSRKVNKSAVVRNRIRRRIYETVRLCEPDIIKPFDIVITVFHDTVIDLGSSDLQKQVRRQLADSGILASSSNVSESKPPGPVL